MSSSRNNIAVPVTEEEMAAAREALSWGTSPRLYLSYGMVAMKGMRSALTDAVEAAPSFTVLSPPMGLDFFAVLDGRGLCAVTADGESERLIALLRDAVAQQVYLELLTDSPRFLDAGTSSRDAVVGWWATTLREAFQAFHKEVATCSQGVHGEDAPVPATPTTIVALVLEKYIVIGNCGNSKAVLSRDGELVELSSNSQDLANKGDEKNKSVEKCVSKLTTSMSKLASTHASVSSAPTPAPAAAGVVDVVVVEREARDEFLILASAALWDKVPPAAACAHVRQRLERSLRVTTPSETRITDAQGSPALLAEELARKALHAGSQDNVSVGLILFRDFWARHAVSTVHRPAISQAQAQAQAQATANDRASWPVRKRRTRRPNSTVSGRQN